jgi:3-carboxy-cis,cis-muconate cycloisomerase
MISAFEHPFLSGLLGDEEMAALLGIEAEMAAMLRFETALVEAQAELGLIPVEAATSIAGTIATFKPDMNALKNGTARDGVVVPDLIRQIRQAVEGPSSYVHFGATSQDVIDTALVLRVLPCLDLLDRRLTVLAGAFADLSRRFGERPLLAHTRMQPAMPIRVADRIESWRAPLQRSIERLQPLRRSVGVIQFGGAVGTLDAFGDKGTALRAALAARLNLTDVPQWQSQRDRIAELANWQSLVTGSLGKFGQDVALMMQTGGAIELAGGGTSSAMAHKQNPVDAEALVALARFTATQLSGMHHALVHEQERSGAAWTLEWLILPQMLIAVGGSTAVAARLIKRIQTIGHDLGS